MAKAIPDGFHAITAALTVRHGAQAIDFYKRALGAEELMRIPGPDGKSLMHAELKIGDSIFMLSDEQPGVGCRAPASVGGPTSYLYEHVCCVCQHSSTIHQRIFQRLRKHVMRAIVGIGFAVAE